MKMIRCEDSNHVIVSRVGVLLFQSGHILPVQDKSLCRISFEAEHSRIETCSAVCVSRFQIVAIWEQKQSS